MASSIDATKPVDGVAAAKSDQRDNWAAAKSEIEALQAAGNVVGPSSSTDNAVARFDSTTGKLLQDGVVLIDDSGNITGVGTITSGAQTITGTLGVTGIINIDNVRIDGNSITSTDTNGDLNLTPNGIGDLVLDGVKWPQADGANTNVLQTNGAGQLSWVAAASGDMLAANNLSDVANAATAFGNIKQAATTSATGVSERATDAEAVTGSDTARHLTPANLTARFADPGAFGGTTPAAGEFTTLILTSSCNLTHTATFSDDHALGLTVDAAGFGNIEAVHISYTSGAIASGEDEAVILVDINETAATGGDVFGLEVLSTDGGADNIYGIKAGAVVAPILQESGSFANPTTGTNNTTSTDVADMIDGSTGTNTTIFVADNDYILIGAAAAFTEIEFIIETPAANPGIQPTFGYSISGAHQFTTFSPVDGTNGFRNTGVVAWDAQDLTSHTTNDDTGTFDIKIIRTHNSAGSVSLFYAKTAATVVYGWDKDGIVTVNTLEPTGDTASSDNAAVGYTAAEGLILTGQGSTNDVTIKNDADADVAVVPTGTTTLELKGAFILGGAVTGGDNTVSAINLKDYGEITNALGDLGGGTDDIDLNAGNVVTATVSTSGQTFTFSNPTASDEGCSFTLILTNGGSQTVTWPASVDWAGGTAPTLTTSGVDVLVFLTVDGGTIWNGAISIANSS